MDKRKFSMQEVSQSAQEALDNWDLEDWEAREPGAVDALKAIQSEPGNFTGNGALDLDDSPQELSGRPRWRDIWQWLEETAETVANCV